MQNARFGRRRYVDAVEEEVEDEGGDATANRSQIMENMARKQGLELQREAVRKKFLF